MLIGLFVDAALAHSVLFLVNWTPSLTDRSRCSAGPGFSATSVSNTAGMPAIERQLYGTSTVKIFLLPESCHPGAPAPGRIQLSLGLNSRPHCSRSSAGRNDRNLAVNLNFCKSGCAADLSQTFRPRAAAIRLGCRRLSDSFMEPQR